MINLNYSHQPEYDLYNTITDELINGYGILSKYIVTEKVDMDTSTFGEWTSLKAENNDVYEVFLLPDTTENWQGQNIVFDQFGLNNFSTMEFFISERGLHTIFPFWEESININDMISDLILMPSGKVLEVTHVEPLVEGVNNLFSYDDNKNTVKITCRNYQFRKNDELDVDALLPNEPQLTPAEKSTQENLDDYFTRLIDSDEIPDENYEDKPGKIDVIDYHMDINDIMFISDGLFINGIDVGSDVVQSHDDLNIIESSSSIKTKQDKKAEEKQKEERVIVKKEDEYSSPFGELG
jgi:hypothetical protein